MIRPELILSIVAVPVLSGIVLTRLRARAKQRGTIAARLAHFVPEAKQAERPVNLIVKKISETRPSLRLILDLPVFNSLEGLLLECGMEEYLYRILAIDAFLMLAPALIAFGAGFDMALGALAGLALASLPFFYLKAKAEARRRKFSHQLPDAIDLMVAVLRSGHSVSQSVKSVAQEIAHPCGEEFGRVLRRMDLGQPLGEALMFSAERFRSYELDLMRRGVGIQAEVGGSLADLLDKTNTTLRGRLRLARQLEVSTSQSRLSAQIVGFMPIVLAIGLNYLSPGYLQLLWYDDIGRLLLMAVVVLQVLGFVVMTKMSTMKV